MFQANPARFSGLRHAWLPFRYTTLEEAQYWTPRKAFNGQGHRERKYLPPAFRAVFLERNKYAERWKQDPTIRANRKLVAENIEAEAPEGSDSSDHESGA